MTELVGVLNYIVFFAITAVIYAVVCLGLNLQWGYTGLMNIGVAGFYAIGAYTSALVSGPPPGIVDWRVFGGFEFPFIVGLFSAAIVSGFFALIIGIPVLRLREDYLAIATIGIAETMRLVIKNEEWLTNGPFGLKGIPAPFRTPIDNLIGTFINQHPNLTSALHKLLSRGYNWFYLLLVLAILTVLYFAIERIVRSPWGRVLKAIREDEKVTVMAGKNIFSFKLQSFILGAMIMGAGGSLYAHYAMYITPSIFNPLFGTFLIWVMLIAGGSGNNKGAILGAFVIWGLWTGTEFLTGQLEFFSSGQVAALRIVAVGVFLELILLYRPRGILGEQKQISNLLRE